MKNFKSLRRAAVFVICHLLFVICYFSFVPPALAQCPPEAPNCNEPSTPPSSGNGGLGTISVPNSAVPTTDNPEALTAKVVRSFLTLLLIIAFIIALIWNVMAGLKFITSNGDPKGISEAWSRIYWGIIGLVVVLGSFAIIKMVEAFFHIQIISGGLKLPTI